MRKAIVFILMGLLATSAWAQRVDWTAYKPTGYISDYAGLLSEEERLTMEGLIADLNAAQKAQIAILVLPSLYNYDISELSKFFYESWDVGGTTQQRAGLMILSADDSSVHLHIGAGLKSVLDKNWEERFAGKVAATIEQGEPSAIVVAGLRSILEQIYNNASVAKSVPATEKTPFATLPKQRKSSPFGTGKQMGDGMSIPGGQNSGIPTAALVAMAFGGFLLLSTMFRAKAYTEKSVYDYGRDFERGRTGPFGNKTPRWQK